MRRDAEPPQYCCRRASINSRASLSNIFPLFHSRARPAVTNNPVSENLGANDDGGGDRRNHGDMLGTTDSAEE